MMQVGLCVAVATRMARSSRFGKLLGNRPHLYELVTAVLEQREQVDLLLVGAAHCRARRLADDRHHGHMVQLGVVQAVEQMHGSRARCRRAHTDLTGEFGVANGLECRHLLVTSLDELGLVACPPPRRQQSVDAVSRVPEDLLHAPVAQPGQHEICNRFTHF